jgi:Zn-dependent protease with chaperone function
MPQADKQRASHRLTRRTYSLTSRRGPSWAMIMLGLLAAACAAAALAAAGFALVTSRENSKKADALCAPPMSEREIREQLAKARIALDHEVATRLVLQQQATDSAAEIHQMRTDLAFIKRQRDKSN